MPLDAAEFRLAHDAEIPWGGRTRILGRSSDMNSARAATVRAQFEEAAGAQSQNHSLVEERLDRRRWHLEATYGSDAALGARYDEDENLTVLPNGTSAAKCTNYALLI